MDELKNYLQDLQGKMGPWLEWTANHYFPEFSGTTSGEVNGQTSRNGNDAVKGISSKEKNKKQKKNV